MASSDIVPDPSIDIHYLGNHQHDLRYHSPGDISQDSPGWFGKSCCILLEIIDSVLFQDLPGVVGEGKDLFPVPLFRSDVSRLLELPDEPVLSGLARPVIDDHILGGGGAVPVEAREHLNHVAAPVRWEWIHCHLFSHLIIDSSILIFDKGSGSRISRSLEKGYGRKMEMITRP